MKSYFNPGSLSLIAIFFLFCSMSGCITTRNLSKVDLTELNKVIEMSKSPCYGRCPVFTFSIYENGVASFKGDRYTERIGLWVKQFSKDELEEMLSAFRVANLWQFNNVYRGEYYDAPTVTITYYEEGDVKTIVGKDGRPYQVLELEAMLDNAARSEGWQQITGDNHGFPPNVITNEIIVELKEGRDGKMWIRQYRRYEMEIVERISPTGNYWLVRYNAEATAPEEMLEKVRNDVEVMGAEFNKKLNLRG
ncbi:MAG: DUF6438 domain-containing protein [Saprospiraceae bacterium]|nr:DUF6438 domain-containing protein [Saprospiraceae bacterium]